MAHGVTDTLAAANSEDGTVQKGTNDPQRSAEAAKESTKALSEAQKDPLTNGKSHQKAGVTFAAQDKLPKLPIPDLDSSCKKYLEALEPLQTNGEHEDTVNSVNEFLKGEGPELQDKLKKYATDKSSYIEQFCVSLGLGVVI